jgi:spore coat polysaccharide biosynthesis protein SpsF
MKIGALVQARMQSTRAPGKVLRPLAGRPLLAYLLERLERARGLDLVAVATSDEAADDALEAFCTEHGVACHRGPLEDVTGRFVEAARRFELDALVRVNGDSAFLDQDLVTSGVELFRAAEVDLVTNVFPRSFPVGESVEVISAPTLEGVHAETSRPEDLEHVTQFFYRHPDRFRIVTFSAEEDHSGESLAFDHPEDAGEIEAMLALMTRPHWDYGWHEVLKLQATARVEAP